jgi:hypothetical protein
MHCVAPFHRQRRKGGLPEADARGRFRPGHGQDAAHGLGGAGQVAGREVEGGGLAHQGAAAFRVCARQQRIERDVRGIRVAVEDLAVGIGKLHAFHDGVDELLPRRVHARDVIAFQQRQGLQQHRALAPGAGLVHRHPRIVAGNGALHLRAVAGEVIGPQHAAVAAAAGIHQFRRAVEAVHRLGHEATVEGIPRGLDLALTVGAGRLGLGQDAAIGGGDARRAEAGARARHLAAR